MWEYRNDLLSRSTVTGSMQVRVLSPAPFSKGRGSSPSHPATFRLLTAYKNYSLVVNDKRVTCSLPMAFFYLSNYLQSHAFVILLNHVNHDNVIPQSDNLGDRIGSWRPSCSRRGGRDPQGPGG